MDYTTAYNANSDFHVVYENLWLQLWQPGQNYVNTCYAAIQLCLNLGKL